MGIHEVGPWLHGKLRQKFQDSFEVKSRIGAPHCSLDMDTWEIENELKETRARFGEAMDEAMSDVEEA